MLRAPGIASFVLVWALAGCAITPQAIDTTAVAEPVVVTRAAPAIEPRLERTVPEPTDLWQTIRNGLVLHPSGVDAERVDAAVRWFAQRPRLLEAIAPGAELYYGYVVAAVRERGLPLEVALLPIVESTLNPYAVSPRGASGLWQLMPSTARRYGVAINWWYDGRRDPVDSTRAALDYIEYLHEFFAGDWLMTFAAYNCGEGCIAKARRKAKSDSYWNLKLPKETSKYVPRILALAHILEDPSRYGWALPRIDMEPAFALAALDDQVDVGKIAQLAELSHEELFRLNPGLNRQATPPDGPHRLLIPAASAPSFDALMTNYPHGPERWVQHRVRTGESLSTIAAHYHTNVPAIRANNALKGSLIRAGQELLVPVAASGTLPSNPMLAAAGFGRRAAVHRVSKGESLWSIARRYDVSIAKLAIANGIDVKRPLRIGQKLSVPSRNGVEQRPTQYRVRSGDSLWAIANRFQVTVADLLRWNDLEASATLRPGVLLNLDI